MLTICQAFSSLLSQLMCCPYLKRFQVPVNGPGIAFQVLSQISG